MGAAVGQPPSRIFWSCPLRISAERLFEYHSATTANIPSTIFPEAVASRPSVTETSSTPARSRAARISA